MDEVAYILDGVKYNKYNQVIEVRKTDRTELKRLDKVFNTLSKLGKVLNEDVIVKLINMIKDSGFESVLIFCLRIEDISTANALSLIAKEIDYYKKIAQMNMSSIIMASIHSPISLKIALDLETALYPIPDCGKMDEEMIICLYRHSIVFPENRDICISCIRSYNLSSSIFTKPFFFFQDEVEIVSKYFNKSLEVKNYIFKNIIDHGAVNIARKALNYYKEDPKILVKMSLPILLKNDKIFSIYESQNTVISEACVYNRWELLPFIFENYKLNSSIWDTIKFILYKGMLNETFIITLFNLMKKYDVNIDVLVQENKIITCSQKFKDAFESYGYGKKFNFNIEDKYPNMIDSSVASMFEFYLIDNLEYIKIQLFITYAHKNKRFIEEKDYILDLITSGKIEWNDDMKQKFYKFNDLCNNFCFNLELVNILIVEYNSYLAVSFSVNHMMAMRFLNKVRSISSKITEKFLIDECQYLFKRFEEDYWRVLNLVRNDIGLEDLEDGEDWVQPENPTLEDLFKGLYQYGIFKNTGYSNSTKLVNALQSIGYNKIAHEVELAIASLISIDDIIEILKRKNIVFDTETGTLTVS